MRSKLLLVGVALVVILSTLFIFYSLWPRCSTFKSLETSLTVESAKRSIIGLNADTDSLAFGKVSPSAGVRRSVVVNYTEDATVHIFMDSPFASWVSITPHDFNLSAGQSQEVNFNVNVPAYTPDASYTGTVVFCFRT